MTDDRSSINNAPQIMERAIACHQAGQLPEAVKLFQVVLETFPQHPEANHSIGVLAVQMQQPAAALAYFMAALEADPVQRQYWLSYIEALLLAEQPEQARQMLAFARQQGLEGDDVERLAALLEGDTPEIIITEVQSVSEQRIANSPKRQKEPAPREIDKLVALFAGGRLTEATALARALTKQFPNSGIGWKALGTAYEKLGRIADALPAMQKAAELSPGDTEVLYNLGAIFQGLGRLQEAEDSYRRALRGDNSHVSAHCNLGIILEQKGMLAEAAASYRRALQINPGFAKAHSNLGSIFQKLGRLLEAEASYRQALQINPAYAEAHSNLGFTLRDLGRALEAEASCRRAIQLKPNFPEAYNNLGITLQDLCRLGEAEASIRHALRLKPDYAKAHSNLGALLNELGNLTEAEVSLRRSLQINPSDAEVHSNLIFVMDMAVDSDTTALLEERKLWNVTHAVPLQLKRVYSNLSDPERLLRIGYVSADFRIHSAAYVFGIMLHNFDRSQFEVTAYSNSTTVDILTRDFQQQVNCWRNIVGLSDEAVDEIIQKDQIDILVDLSGHSAGNRLLVFARKPAPLQITAWGYAAGTGMSAMDVLFADPVVIPPEERQLYTEQIRYLPNIIGSFISPDFPPVNALPALSAKGITFGSFNRLVKNSDQAFGAWVQILQAIPESRMFFKSTSLDDANARNRVLSYFTQAGIASERILFQGKTSREMHMTALNQVDIILDSFPHGGGVTALEGLMMGVPLVVLRWPTLAGRVSSSIMTTIGLTDWIAESQQEYIELAIQKAKDLQSLSELRQQLRNRFTSSILGDQLAYVRAVEQEYRQLWREWCHR